MQKGRLMDKFLKPLFYTGLGIFVAGIIYLSAMLFAAPRSDALKRGFIPCTEQLVADIYSCKKGSIGCPLKFMLKDMNCNIKVIGKGFSAWFKGEQKTPWSNYLFDPKTAAETDADFPYRGSVLRDMDELEARRLFIEAKQAEFEALKNRQLKLKDDVVVPAADPDVLADDVKISVKEEEIRTAEPGDISEEAFVEEITEEKTGAEAKDKTAVPSPQKDVRKQLGEKTAAHLNKKEIKDEK